MRISHNYIIVFYLLFAFDQISADVLSKIPKVQKEYDFMCGCKHIFYKNQFGPSENHFSGSTQSTTVAYNGQSNKVETNRWSEFSELIIPDEVVECFMAGKYSRLTGYFLTEPKKYFKITAEYQLDGSSVWQTLEIKKFPGAPFWKKFDYYFDLVNMPTTKKVKILVQSPVDLGEDETEDQIYSLYLDEFRICKYCDGVVSVPLPALKKLEANTGELVTLSENNFKLSVSTGTSNLKIKPVLEPSFAGSTIKVNGSTVSSGSFSQDIYLDPDKSTFIYVEVSQSLCERNLYVVEVKNPEGPDATLFDLKTSEGSISPSFYSFQNNYTIWVGIEITKLRLIPVSNDRKATISVDGKTVESGTESHEIDVSVDRSVLIVVTAKDGITQRTYNVMIKHETPIISFTTSTGTGVEKLTNPVIEVEISPAPKNMQTFTVQYEIDSSSTATIGADFNLTNGILTFDQSNTKHRIPLTIINDEIDDGGETVVIRLTNPTGGAVLGINPVYTYTIINDDNIVFVRANMADTNGNGRTWNTAYKNLHDAIDYARDTTNGIKEIWVAEGRYVPETIANYTFKMIENVKFVGGFPPNGGSLNERNHKMHATILSGDKLNNDGESWPKDGDESVLNDNIGDFVKGASYSILDGFVIEKGHIEGFHTGSPGGAMTIGGACTDMQINNCVFRFNLNRFIISGAIYTDGQNIIFNNCEFLNNKNTNGPGGGAVYNTGTIKFNGCVFEGNISEDEGGAIHNRGIIEIVKCRFVNNSASNGGAIYSIGTLSVHNSFFAGNLASAGGGAISYSNALRRGSINDEILNIPPRTVNAFLTIDSSLITNCLFKENAADYGGAIEFLQPPKKMNIRCCSFIKNRANSEGSTFSMDNLTFSYSININSSIFYNNVSPDNEEISADSLSKEFINISYSRINDQTWCNNCVNNTTLNPMLDTVEWRLTAESIGCINKGDPNLIPGNFFLFNGNVLDLGNEKRFVSTRIDMGAYEYQY